MAELRAERRRDGRVGLMGHVIADHPSPDAVRGMIGAMVEAGAEVIEIQIPFSEPMADGPLFLAANHAALAAGVDFAASLRLMREVTARYPQCSFVFMSYLNPVFKRGYARFAAEAAGAGASGVIVPDLPLELGAPLDQALDAHGLTNIRLLAPNCPDERLTLLAAHSRRLVYAVARSGVTGAKSDFGGEIKTFLDRIRARTDIPIGVGFGVRQADDVRRLRGLADLAIVGTASLQTWHDRGLEGVQQLWRELATAARS